MRTERMRNLKKFIVAAFCVVSVIMMRASDNACCGCHSAGCGNNWVCVGVVLGEISGCCGMGDGTVKCKGGKFCTTCDGGGSCGSCTDDEPMEAN